MKRKFTVFIFCWCLIVFVSLSHSTDQNHIDLSEKIIKIKSAISYRFGKQGFGFYDWADGKLKIFNWNLEVEKAIPITLGEGPGEIKPFIFNACLVKDNILLNGYMGEKINIYNMEGKFTKSIIIDFSPRLILYHQKKLYIFNAAFFETRGSKIFAKIIDPLSGNTIKEVRLKDKIGSDKAFDGNTSLSRRLYRFDVGDNSNIYLLGIAENTLFEINENGKLIKETKLPHKFRMKYNVEKEGKNTLVNIAMYDLYHDFMVIKNTVYACYQKTVKQDEKTGELVVQTHVVKLNNKGKYSQRILDGDFKIIGEHMDILYLFNFEDYHVLPINLNEF